MNKIEIPLSKIKILLPCIIVATLLFISLFVIDSSEQYHSYLLGNKIIDALLKAFSYLVLIALSIFSVAKMFKRNQVVIIDDQGITNNTNLVNPGLIEWADIERIETITILHNHLLLIYTTAPEKYLQKLSSIKRFVIFGDEKLYGTPFSININPLPCSSNELERLINERLNEYRENSEQ